MWSLFILVLIIIIVLAILYSQGYIGGQRYSPAPAPAPSAPVAGSGEQSKTVEGGLDMTSRIVEPIKSMLAETSKSVTQGVTNGVVEPMKQLFEKMTQDLSAILVNKVDAAIQTGIAKAAASTAATTTAAK